MTATSSRSIERRRHGRALYARPGRRLADRSGSLPARCRAGGAGREVVVIDTGLCNLDSMMRAIRECGGAPLPTDDPDAVRGASRIILPGVGTFGAAMERLERRGLVAALRDIAAARRTPILGVCIGMQVLGSVGEEGGERPGLGLIPGRVRRLESRNGAERVPHVGWNSVRPQRDCALLQGIGPDTDFYFVHSYHLVPDAPEAAVAATDYCGGFVSAVQSGLVYGTQFHIEKSLGAGFRVIRNFLEIRNAPCVR